MTQLEYLMNTWELTIWELNNSSAQKSKAVIIAWGESKIEEVFYINYN